MTENTPSTPRKNRNWIWIVVAVLVTGLLCLLVLGGAFAFSVWKGYILFPSHTTRNLPMQTSPSNPYRDFGTQSTPEAAPQAAPDTLTVEPYQPRITDRYPALQQLVPDWKDLTGPGTNTYDLSLPYAQSVVLTSGWCTTTQALLDQNFQQIQYTFEVDGKLIDLSQFNTADQKTSDGVCRQYTGLIRAWPTGSHTIKISMRVDAKINDGWNDYAAGDYVEVYNIKVK
jgi:hypothetical protein